MHSMEFHISMLLTIDPVPVDMFEAVFLVSLQLNYHIAIEAPLLCQSIVFPLLTAFQSDYRLDRFQLYRNKRKCPYIRKTHHNTRNNSYQVHCSISLVVRQFRECLDLYQMMRVPGE